MSNTWKRTLSLLLAVVMMLSLGVTGFAEGAEGHGMRREIARRQNYDMLSLFHRMMPSTQKTQKMTYSPAEA